MEINYKIPFLSSTIKKFTIWNAAVFSLLILFFDFAALFITVAIINQTLESRLEYEKEKILNSVSVNNTLSLSDFKEINEPDFLKVNENSFFLRIYDNSGKLLFESQNIKIFPEFPAPDQTYFKEKSDFYEDINLSGMQLRYGSYKIYNKNGSSVGNIFLASFKRDTDAIFHKVVIINVITFPLVLLLIVLASYYLARKSISPLYHIIETVDRISLENFKDRLTYQADDNDVLGRLKNTLNQLFARTESYIDKISQFTDHASHQLMNPLTALKTELDFILKKERSAEEYKESIKMFEIQTNRMISIIKTLLIISKTENKQSNQNKILTNFSDIINSEIKRMYNSPRFVFSVEPNIFIKALNEQLTVILINLIDNAVKYSSQEDKIEIILKSDGNNIELSVKDLGIGISDSEKEKVFERFYRCENAERQGSIGFGLGLSLVYSLVKELKGKIFVSDNKPKGTIFKIIFPRVILE